MPHFPRPHGGDWCSVQLRCPAGVWSTEPFLSGCSNQLPRLGTFQMAVRCSLPRPGEFWHLCGRRCSAALSCHQLVSCLAITHRIHVCYIYGNIIYHQYTPNVSIYTIHGYGLRYHFACVFGLRVPTPSLLEPWKACCMPSHATLTASWSLILPTIGCRMWTPELPLSGVVGMQRSARSVAISSTWIGGTYHILLYTSILYVFPFY